VPRHGSRHRLAKHISRDASGIAVRISLGGAPIEKRFPRDTPLATVTRWRDAELRRRAERLAQGRAVEGTFEVDAATYLAAVTALPEYDQRRRDIEIWCERFKGRQRHTIAPVEIRTARDAWLTVGPRMVQVRGKGYVPVAKPLSASTVNKRLRALENMWTVLDGRKAHNPAREVPDATEPDALPRGLSYAVIERILHSMADSQTRARLRVMAYTGLAQVELAGITPADLDLTRGAVLVRRRRKGRHGKAALPVLHPLTADALTAFHDFVRLGCWGAFSVSSMWKSFRLAASRAGYTGLRPYDLRHSYGTAVYHATGDLATTQGLLRQRSSVTTLRYVAAAVAPRAAHAAAAFQRQVTAQKSADEAKRGTRVGPGRKR
jgi:integrase